MSTNAGLKSTAHQGTGLGFAFALAVFPCAALDAEEHRFVCEKTISTLTHVRATEEAIASFV
jgi:hypothetical protein